MTEKDRDLEKEGAMSDSTAIYGDPSAEAAAETLRAVEAMRRRTESLAAARAFPLWVWAACYVAALPIAAFAGETAGFIAAGLAGVIATTITFIDYRRQPVHAARQRRKLSIGEGIVLAVALLLVGPMFLWALVLIAATPMVAYVGASVLALFIGSRAGNRVLALAGVLGLIGAFLSPFIWSDHWPALAVTSYMLAFSLGGVELSLAERRSQ
jgi:hypothetical protein